MGANTNLCFARMEEGEDRDGILVEGKTFSCHPSLGGFTLKEVEKELTLSLKHATEIREGLLERNQEFRRTIRRESK